MNRITSYGEAMSVFDELNGYEKGVTARAFLEQLISQGRFNKSPKGEETEEIIIPMKPWQLELLACFCRKEEIVCQTPHDVSTCCHINGEHNAPRDLTASLEAVAVDIFENL